MTVRGADPQFPTEVRSYDVELPDVPTMLRQLANELETDHHTYLHAIFEHTHRERVLGYTVMLERDGEQGIAQCPQCTDEPAL